MTALPSSVLAGQTVRTAVLVTGRRGVRLPSACGAPNCVVRGRGRRAGAAEALVKELLEAGVSSVVVPALAALHPSPARALGIVATLHAGGVVVHSLAEPSISSADGATLATVATFLLASERQTASKKGAAIVAALGKAGRHVGRPAKALTVTAHQVQKAVERLGWRRGAKAVGASPSAARRLLALAGLLPITPARRAT